MTTRQRLTSYEPSGAGAFGDVAKFNNKGTEVTKKQDRRETNLRQESLTKAGTDSQIGRCEVTDFNFMRKVER